MKYLSILVFLVLVFSFQFSVPTVFADECDNPSALSDTNIISGCISKFNGIADAISKANATNSKQLSDLKAQIDKFQNQIALMEKQIADLTKATFDRKVKIGVLEKTLSAKVLQDYINKRSNNVLTTFFSSKDLGNLMRDITYRERLAQNDRRTIVSISGEVTHLQQQTADLTAQKHDLAAIKKQVDAKATWLAAEVAKANSFVSDLSGKIAALSARQQSLLAEKSGSFTTSVGDVPLADDLASRPNYNPGFSPAFAAFSFGAPHYKGMSQYGAYGRAKSGQNVEQILRVYYGSGIEIKKDFSTGINLTVSGYGSVNIETYVKRIYEMPTSWGDNGGFEALKAQAVAARSYALAYTANGTRPICATESCQVYKPANKGGKWDEAVEATKGWVLMAGGAPFSAWYASTSGGYQESYTHNGHTTPGFWDTTSDWTKWADGAYEVKGGSPWFYKGWYKTRSGKTCGRTHPWLSVEEMSDIVNAALVYTNGGDTSGLFPIDIQSCWGGGGNPWSKEKMAEEAGKYGGAVTQISNVRVEHSRDGYTNRIIFNTNRGEVVISGAQFVKAFNLRAPGALNIKSGLFNLERK